MKQTLRFNHLATPIGNLWVGESESGIAEVVFREGESEGASSPLLQQAIVQLEAYFAGELQNFTFALAAQGTVFQKTVWRALLDVSYGSTTSYGAIATAINNAKAVRAVGAANGKNPIAIVVPCHRIVGANGTLTGYNGGLERKQWLLAHEQRVKAQTN